MENKCHIALVGLNYKTAATRIRNRISFSNGDLALALAELSKSSAIKELVLLSTCNRIEFIMATDKLQQALQEIQNFLLVKRAFGLKEFEDSIYLYTGNDAVRHLCRVASGLDSLLIGEPQILGQLKAAYKMAMDAGTTGLLLNKLFHRSFAVAKRVRNETHIGAHAVSISYAAIELANQTFESLYGKKVLLIGSGDMAELALSHFIRREIKKAFILNRSCADCEKLACKYNAEPLPVAALSELLTTVDIVISSTSSAEFVITERVLTSAMGNRNGSPLLLIDIAVPRDVEPAANPIENVYIYNIDDLKSIVVKNIQARNREVWKGDAIVDDAVMLHENWFNSLDAVKTITDLKIKFDRIAAEETKRCKMAMAHSNAEDYAAVEKLAGRIVNKILHHPIGYLRDADPFEKTRSSLDSVRSMFRLDD